MKAWKDVAAEGGYTLIQSDEDDDVKVIGQSSVDTRRQLLSGMFIGILDHLDCMSYQL